MIANVFRPKRKKDGKTVTARLYRGRYRLEGDLHPTEVALETPDKQVAKKKLQKIIEEKEREKAGIIAPKLQRISAERPMQDHLDDFLADLEKQGRSDSYVLHLKGRNRRLIKECSWKFPRDVTPDSFVRWRSLDKNAAPKTLNEYLNAINRLFNWMKGQKRVMCNPLDGVAKVEIRGRQQKRRAFTDEELMNLVQAAPQRRLLYLTAAYSGLRLNELRQLLVIDVSLDEEMPHLKVRSSTTKNKKDALIPLHPALVPEFSSVVKDKEEGENVFHIIREPSVIFNRDLKKAGIEKFDALGRKVDFHALRYTFCTKLSKQGISQRLAQELMRHSDPNLTAKVYTDATQLPTFEAIDSLPFSQHLDYESDAKDTQIDPQKSDIMPHALSQSGGGQEKGEVSLGADNQGFERILTHSVVANQMVLEGGLEPPRPCGH